MLGCGAAKKTRKEKPAGAGGFFLFPVWPEKFT
jgi:hypothetical protein